MTVVVFGAGAIGSLLGARLAESGRSVLLVARPEHADAIRARGLRVEGVGGGTVRCAAVRKLEGAVEAEAVLLTVKAFDLACAAEQLGHAIGPVPVLLLQNGLDIESVAITALRRAGWVDPGRFVVRAVHAIPATWVGPGIVRATGTGEVVLPDPAVSGSASESVERFIGLLRGAGIPVRPVVDFSREVWRKLLVNAAVNPVTACHGVPNGQLASGPLRIEAETLLREALAVSRALGIGITETEAIDDLHRVVRATAENRSSMLQDLDRGRPTEIDAISGEILRRATARGLDLPATRSVIERVRSMSPDQRE